MVLKIKFLVFLRQIHLNKQDGFKDKVLSLSKTNTPKQTVYGRGKKLSKPKTQNKIRNPFILKKKKKETEEKKRKREIRGEKEFNDRLIKDRIIRAISTLFE